MAMPSLQAGQDMIPSTVVTPFSKQPRACLLLAALFATMGALLFCDVIPTSPNRPSAQHTQWILALLCAAGMVFFVYGAAVGFRAKPKP
jgi:hypothetical protein